MENKEELLLRQKLLRNKRNERYRKSEKGKEANRRGVLKFRKIHKKRDLIIQRRSKKKRRLLCPEKSKAIGKVGYHVKTKKILKPDYCEKCGSNKDIEGHHYNGYDSENALNVIWLCIDCHNFIHGRNL